MKKYLQLALLLSITMMFAGQNQVWGQERRTGGLTSSHEDNRRSNASHSETRSGRHNSSPSRSDSRKSYSPGSDRHSGQAPRNDAAHSSASRNSSRDKNSPGHNPAHNGPTGHGNYNSVNGGHNPGTNYGRNHSGGNTHNANPHSTYSNHNGRAPEPGQSHNTGSHNPGSHRPGNYNPGGYHPGGYRPGGVPAPHHMPYAGPHYRPAPSYHHAPHRYGYRLDRLPAGYVINRFGGLDYFFHDGIYYRSYAPGGFVVCRPPVGVRIAQRLFDVALAAITINALNNAAERVERAVALSQAYSGYDNSYVPQSRQVYINNVESQNGEKYYCSDGVFYTLYDGTYSVVEPPVGALIDTIPEDYEEMSIGGETFYKVDNTLYKVVIIDGNLHFEVVCNL